MDSQIAFLIVALIALGGGAVLGWFLGSRPATELRVRLETRDSEAKLVDEKFKDAIRDLASASERANLADTFAAQLVSSQDARRLAETRLAGLESESAERAKATEARYKEREEHFERELRRLVEAEEKLQTKFSEIGEKLLSSAQAKFLESANSQLETLNKESLAELEKKVAPMGESLERYRKRIDQIEIGRAEAYNQLQGVIGEVRAGQDRVAEGANRISTSLRGASKARGDWGEVQFTNLLESCGLVERTDFNCQVSLSNTGTILRADAIINIPGNKKIVVDVKNAFNTYTSANEAETEEQRRVLLRAHAREIRGHVDDLASKRYQDFVPGSADFILMFIPGEHVLYTAISEDNGLLEYALRKRVVLTSPLNFMSISLTIAMMWRQVGEQADAEEIAKLGKELYDRLGVVAGHLSSLRKSLQSTNQHFDSLIGSFDGNLRRTGERFEKLSVDTTAKELSEASPLNITPRRLANFSDSDDQPENA
ncbi:MAG: DNA recombination protein RmuC [Novosphingobium sp.]